MYAPAGPNSLGRLWLQRGHNWLGAAGSTGNVRQSQQVCAKVLNKAV